MFSHLFPVCTFFSFLEVEVSLCTLYARISPQWLSKLRQLWPNVPSQVMCKLISKKVPTPCLDSGTVSPLRLCWVKSVCVFRCDLPLLSEWPGSFTCHCGNTGVNRHWIRVSTQINSGEENSPTAPAEIRTRNLLITSPTLLPTNYPGWHSRTQHSKVHIDTYTRRHYGTHWHMYTAIYGHYGTHWHMCTATCMHRNTCVLQQ